ncbi:MAG: dipeptidase [Chitinophagaceae bacterium]
MKVCHLAFCTLFAIQTIAQNASKLHQKSIVVDTHNDVISGVIIKGKSIETNLLGKAHTDIKRMQEGGIDVQMFSIFCDERYGKNTAFAFANRQIDSLYAIVNRNPNVMQMAYNTKDVNKVVKQQKIACMIGVEGGHMIEDRLDYLDSLFKRGARYLTLTWNNSTSWATSAKDEVKNPNLSFKGLTPFGKQIVQRMNALGMMVDLSHVGERTFYDAIETSTKPIIVSHSCVYKLCGHQRNLKDDQIKAVAKNGGVIHLNFYSGFLDSNYMKNKEAFLANYKPIVDSLKAKGVPEYELEDVVMAMYPKDAEKLRAPFELLLTHIDYIRDLIGVDYIGLGSDFDGIESAPIGLDGVQNFPSITEALINRGYSKKDVEKILGLNFLRVLKANQKNVIKL